MSLLSIRSLTKTYGAGHTVVHAVNNISLDVKKGEIVLVMGPSGSGKTTLIMMMAGLLTPTAGDIRIEEKSILGLSKQQLAQIRLERIGFVFQSFNLLSSLNALENVMIPLIISGTAKKEAQRHAKETLTKFGLKDRLKNQPRDLSGGEKQRVSIARALVNNPPIIFADEPTANLDSHTGQAVMRLLCGTACRESKAVVIVSHDQRLKDIAHRVLWIEDGKLTNEDVGGHVNWCDMDHREW